MLCQFQGGLVVFVSLWWSWGSFTLNASVFSINTTPTKLRNDGHWGDIFCLEFLRSWGICWFADFASIIVCGSFNIFLMFTLKIGEIVQFDEHIFQMGWNHQLIHEKNHCIDTQFNDDSNRSPPSLQGFFALPPTKKETNTGGCYIWLWYVCPFCQFETSNLPDSCFKMTGKIKSTCLLWGFFFGSTRVARKLWNRRPQRRSVNRRRNNLIDESRRNDGSWCWLEVFVIRDHTVVPIGSMYGICPYIYRKYQLNVGVYSIYIKYHIHGSYGV